MSHLYVLVPIKHILVGGLHLFVSAIIFCVYWTAAMTGSGS